MSEEVKRYDIVGNSWDDSMSVVERDEGDYILYTDHESTLQALADTKAQLEALEDRILNASPSEAIDMLSNLQEEIQNSRARKQG